MGNTNGFDQPKVMSSSNNSENIEISKCMGNTNGFDQPKVMSSSNNSSDLFNHLVRFVFV